MIKVFTMSKKRSLNLKYDKQAKIEKIIECVKAHPEGITPKQVAREIGLQDSTTRGLMIELSNREMIFQEHSRALYFYNDEFHTPSEVLKIQNVNMRYDCKNFVITRTDKKIWDMDDFRLTMLAGITHNRFTCHLKAEPPANYREFKLLASIFKEYIISLSQESITLKDILAISFEFNRDDERIRLDGIKAITVYGLYHEMRKLYQRDNCVRSEVKVKRVSLDVPTVLNAMIEGRKQCLLSEINRKLKDTFGIIFREITYIKNKLEGMKP